MIKHISSKLRMTFLTSISCIAATRADLNVNGLLQRAEFKLAVF